MGQDTRERRVVVNGAGHQREEGGGEWGRVVNGERVKRTWRNKIDQPGHIHEQVKQVPVVSAWKYQKVVGSNPCRSGGRMLFSRVIFLY